MLSDYHVHSKISFDSKEEPQLIVEKAITLGMSQICLTEHQDYHWPVPDEIPLIDFNQYNSTINVLRNNYGHQIDILKGVELGLTPGNAALCEQLMECEHFDFIIGSCHIVDNMDPYYSAFWENKTERDAFELYFKTTLEGLRDFHQIDALGHLDYIVRYSPSKGAEYSVNDYRDMIDEILKFIIEKDIKLEINTANITKGFQFPNPHTDIIKRYKELGGKYITVGSDAHVVTHIGQHFETAQNIAEQLGLKVYSII